MKMYNPTEAELDLILTRPGYRIVGEPAPPPAVLALEPPPAPPVRSPRYRSKTEARYAAYLDLQQIHGQITAWAYEPVRLWLAPGLRFTPDFCVQKGNILDLLPWTTEMPVTLSPAFAAAMADLDSVGLTCIEVKASVSHVFEPSRALDRVKMAAHLYPMLTFVVAQWDRKRHDWTERML